jgi:hypothetical protein
VQRLRVRMPRGARTVSVRAVDRAGNIGPAATLRMR